MTPDSSSLHRGCVPPTQSGAVGASLCRVAALHPRRRSWQQFVIAAIGSLCVVAMWVGDLQADETLSRREKLQRAHAARGVGRYFQAEQMFREVFDGTDENNPEHAEIRRVCTEQLFEIYYRVGQYDKAVQFGLPYREHLAATGDARRLRSTDLRLGECYFTLAHYRPAARFLQQALDAPVRRPLDPIRKMDALATLATIADRLGHEDEAQQRWRSAAAFGQSILDNHRNVLSLRDQISMGRNLARAARQTGDTRTAIEQLNALVTSTLNHRYEKGRQQLYGELARQYVAAGDLKQAIATLEKALEVKTDNTAAAAMIRGDLLSQYASVLLRDGQTAAGRAAGEQAADVYRDVMQRTADHRHDSLESLNAFWKLKDLLRQTQQYQQAVELVSEQPWSWNEESLPANRLTSERGALHAAVGSYDEARRFLRRALELRRRQKPLNLSQLPRTLNNLALVEQATGNFVEADALCRECLSLYEQHELPPDRDLAETYNLLATNSALRASYAEAVRQFRKGIEICRKCGPEADGHRGNLLLNLAKTYKSQGQFAEAIEQCEEALEIARETGAVAVDSVSLPAVYCALATMHAAQQDFEKARTFAEQTLDICAQNQVTDGPVVSTAQHCLAIVALVNKDYDRARELWQQVLEQQKQADQVALTARTYNYLGATAQLQDNLEEAERSYRAALTVLDDNSTTYPVTRFVSLWRLAQVRHIHGDEVESRDLLSEAINIAEETRIGTYGAEQHRADFYAQFAPAFDAVFHLCLRDGNYAQALAYAERGRSRTFLDQLQSAGVDPRQSLRGTSEEALLEQEQELKRRINKIRSQAQQNAADGPSADAQQLMSELRKAQDQYAQIWHRILNASPHYRNLLVKNLDDWGHLQQVIVQPGTMMLYYYLGRSRGYLVLLGDGLKHPEVFMLEIPAGYRIASLPDLNDEGLEDLRVRGLKRNRAEVDDEEHEFEVSEKPLPLSRGRADRIIDAYLRSLMVDGVASVRGIRRRRHDSADENFGTNSTAMADILVPPRVREFIARLQPERLIVVPDGALHQLPLEALVVKAGVEPRYVLDEFPPISYAPSAGVLAALLEQPREANDGSPTVLTVGDPAYPQSQDPEEILTASNPVAGAYLGLRGQISRLPKTAEESRRVASLFDQQQVTSLQGPQATEENVIAALPRQKFLHFAAHAYVDRQHGNLLGGILLTPPDNRSDAEHYDGVLALNEIYTLPLKRCELAVLSACETNVGPNGAMEAGFSLARAFFKAGARRVVASHWTVEDESTAALVGEFFQEVAGKTTDGHPVDYARALHTARRHVRRQPQWSHPFFWAPFVLIGPAEDDGSAGTNVRSRLGAVSRN